MEQPKCPRCGFVMCEQFDDKPGPRGITYAVPNGKFICYQCEDAKNGSATNAVQEKRDRALKHVCDAILLLEQLEDSSDGTEELGRCWLEVAERVMESRIEEEICDNCATGIFNL